MVEIDAIGLACPAPVLLTKDAIEKQQARELTVMVDNKASKENVCIFLESKGFEAIAEQKGNIFHITGRSKGVETPAPISLEKATGDSPRKMMIIVPTNCMGHGDDVLGSKLIINFLKTLNELGNDLWRLVFVNNGVKLCISGAETLPTLQKLEKDGIKILVCGTCLTHFDLLDKKQVGETTNMLDIVTAMQLADKVITV